MDMPGNDPSIGLTNIPMRPGENYLFKIRIKMITRLTKNNGSLER